MRAIINGTLYDTEADGVEKIGSYARGNASDFHHVREALYLTASGQYFVAGSGGPMTGYSREVFTGGRTGGHGIRAVTENEARQWAEDHMPVDDYLAHFPATTA